MGVWAVFVFTGKCEELDSLWDDKEEALAYVAENLSHVSPTSIAVTWERIEG